MSKPLLKRIKGKRGQKITSFDKEIDKVYDRYKDYIKTDTEGAKVDKKLFKQAINSYMDIRKDEGLSKKDAFDLALKDYSYSSAYSTQGERVSMFTAKDLFRDNKEAEEVFKGLNRGNKGHFKKFESTQLQYQSSETLIDEDDNRINYKIYKYNNIYILSINSPDAMMVGTNLLDLTDNLRKGNYTSIGKRIKVGRKRK